MTAKKPKVALVLGGGAPNLTLMAGALAGLDEAGVEFEVLSTSGAGMLVGLLYAAPKGRSRQEALHDTVSLGVHDWIYGCMPVNYKVFHKVGPLAEAWVRACSRAPRIAFGNSPLGQFWSDFMALGASLMAPSDPMMATRLGLCQPAPWIEDVVDFEMLRLDDDDPDQLFPGDLLLNAWCVEDARMVMFPKEELTPAHFRAALAFPFIYEPFCMDGKTYIEGSAIDPLNFEGLLDRDATGRELVTHDGSAKKSAEARADSYQDIDTIIVLDVLGLNRLIRSPRNLYDAWVTSMIVPLVSIAHKNIRMFDKLHNGPVIMTDPATGDPLRNEDGSYRIMEQQRRRLFEIEFDIAESYWPNVLDWSRSNLEKLFSIGFAAAAKFMTEHPELATRGPRQDRT